MFPTIDKRATGINLRRLMDQCRITVKDVQKLLGLGTEQSEYRWLDGVSMPTIDHLYALSELLQVSIDAIVCGSRKPHVSVRKVKKDNSREKRLFAYYRKMQDFLVA